MRIALLLFVCFNIFPCIYSQDLQITKVNIVDVIKGEIQQNKTIIISAGKITKISSRPEKLENTTTIKSKGKYIIPGLWDMHVHTADTSYLTLFLINGVLGVRDMGGGAIDANSGCESIEFSELVSWRDKIRSGSMLGPRMFLSGPTVSNTGWSTSINIATPKDAENAVSQLKTLGVDFIKVYEKIPFDAYTSLAESAKKTGLPFAGHVPLETVSILQAIKAGQRSIEHLRDHLLMLFTDDTAKLNRFFKEDNWSAEDIKWGLKHFEEGPETLQSLRDNSIWLVPTLTVEKSKISVYDSSYVDDNRRNLLPPSVQKAYYTYVNRKNNMDPSKKRSDSLWWEIQKLLVTRMYKEKVKFLTGTDCGCEGVLPGYSIHEELQLLVDVGFSPLEALRAATINSTNYLNISSMYGSVEVGKVADLVLLDSNPLLNIGSTKQIEGILTNGKFLSKKALRKLELSLSTNQVNIR